MNELEEDETTTVIHKLWLSFMMFTFSGICGFCFWTEGVQKHVMLQLIMGPISALIFLFVSALCFWLALRQLKRRSQKRAT